MSGMRAVRAHGKCILAGEHSVVRGGEALVIPLRSRSLEISWEEGGSGLEIVAGPLSVPFAAALERALRHLNSAVPSLGLRVSLRSDIPMRAGLGSSAALAVATVRFLEALGLSCPNPFALALEIENHFHGTSSGIDVACALASSPIAFRRGQPPAELSLGWKPLLYLADTGLRSSTKECVEKVQKAERPDLDQRMSEAVRLAKAALAAIDNEELERLGAALEAAGDVFREWGLFAGEDLARKLKEAGALAVKPTGSGGGGFLLSLWEKEPPPELGLIPIWEDS
jgi:mevalonate kinase